MKLVELLYQNRDKFKLHKKCAYIAQDGDGRIKLDPSRTDEVIDADIETEAI